MFFHRKPSDEALTAPFIIPVVFENLILVAAGMLFSEIISSVSESALAATGIADSVLSVLYALFGMLITGSSVLVSRQIGAENNREAANTIGQTVLLAFLASSTLTVILLFSASPLLHLLMPRADTSLFSESVRYFRVLMMSLPMYILYGIFNAVCNAMNRSRYCLCSGLVMCISQLGFGWFFIRILHMEEIGGGLAYVCCRTVGLLTIICFFLKDTTYFRLSFRNFLHIRMDFIRQILYIGLPILFEQVFVQLGYLVASTFSVALGTFNAGIYQILNTSNKLITIPQPIAATVSVNAVGHLLGAGKEKDARKSGILIWMWTLLATGLLGAVVIVFRDRFSAFYSTDTAQIASASGIMWILLVMDIAGVSINAIDPQLRAGGDVRFVMTTSLIGVWCLRLPLSWLFSFYFDMGVLGLFLANTISLYFRAVAGLFRHHGKKWIKTNINKDNSEKERKKC